MQRRAAVLRLKVFRSLRYVGLHVQASFSHRRGWGRALWLQHPVLANKYAGFGTRLRAIALFGGVRPDGVPSPLVAELLGSGSGTWRDTEVARVTMRSTSQLRYRKIKCREYLTRSSKSI